MHTKIITQTERQKKKEEKSMYPSSRFHLLNFMIPPPISPIHFQIHKPNPIPIPIQVPRQPASLQVKKTTKKREESKKTKSSKKQQEENIRHRTSK
jgi:hypothetical protein